MTCRPRHAERMDSSKIYSSAACSAVGPSTNDALPHISSLTPAPASARRQPGLRPRRRPCAAGHRRQHWRGNGRAAPAQTAACRSPSRPGLRGRRGPGEVAESSETLVLQLAADATRVRVEPTQHINTFACSLEPMRTSHQLQHAARRFALHSLKDESRHVLMKQVMHRTRGLCRKLGSAPAHEFLMCVPLSSKRCHPLRWSMTHPNRTAGQRRRCRAAGRCGLTGSPARLLRDAARSQQRALLICAIIRPAPLSVIKGRAAVKLTHSVPSYQPDDGHRKCRSLNKQAAALDEICMLSRLQDAAVPYRT